MAQCKTCSDKGYIGLKAHECFGNMPPTDRPCPDCAARAAAVVDTRYKFVIVGTHKSAIDLRTALNRAHCQMNPMAQGVLAEGHQIRMSLMMKYVNLRFVPLNDFGLIGHDFTLDDVLVAGMNRGLMPLSHEVAPQFRLQYRSPIPWRWLIFGSRVFNYLGPACMFIITNNTEGYSLRAVHSNSRILSQYPPNDHSFDEVMTVWRAR